MSVKVTWRFSTYALGLPSQKHGVFLDRVPVTIRGWRVRSPKPKTLNTRGAGIFSDLRPGSSGSRVGLQCNGVSLIALDSRRFNLPGLSRNKGI